MGEVERPGGQVTGGPRPSGVLKISGSAPKKYPGKSFRHSLLIKKGAAIVNNRLEVLDAARARSDLGGVR